MKTDIISFYIYLQTVKHLNSVTRNVNAYKAKISSLLQFVYVILFLVSEF